MRPMQSNAPRGCAARGEVGYAPHTTRARKESASDSLFTTHKDCVTQPNKGANEYPSLNEIRICNIHKQRPPF